MRPFNLKPAFIKNIIEKLSEHDDTAEYVTDNKNKPKPDNNLRYTEKIPLIQNIDEYFEDKVLNYYPDAWYDERKNKIGYEINFTQYFYIYEPPTSLEEINADIYKITTEIQELLRDGFDMGNKTYGEYKTPETKWFNQIPANWDIRPIKHLAKTIPGGTPSTSNLEYWENGNIPWLPSGAVQNCKIEESDANKFITEKGLLNSATKYIGPNSVLVALTGATCANIGFLTFKATANQSVISVEPYNFNSKYVYYALLSQREQILDKKTGGAQSGINEDDVKNILIPEMTLEEQGQMANYLDKEIAKIDVAIAKNEELNQLLEKYRDSLIYHVITGKIDVRGDEK